jgi:hypothetical protein
MPQLKQATFLQLMQWKELQIAATLCFGGMLSKMQLLTGATQMDPSKWVIKVPS